MEGTERRKKKNLDSFRWSGWDYQFWEKFCYQYFVRKFFRNW